MHEFSTFSSKADAIMAALASRSHEWLQWQIVDLEERQHRPGAVAAALAAAVAEAPISEPSTFGQIFLTVHTASEDPRYMGSAQISVLERDSPSEVVTRALRLARTQRELRRDLPGLADQPPAGAESTDPAELVARWLAAGPAALPLASLSCVLSHRRTKTSRGYLSVESKASLRAEHRWVHTFLGSKVF